MASCSDDGSSKAKCGDGVKSDSEQCDDGDNSDSNDCLNTCLNAQHNDGFVWRDTTLPDGAIGDGPEECDDGNYNDHDGCTNSKVHIGFGITHGFRHDL